jgi:hypothetical protein
MTSSVLGICFNISKNLKGVNDIMPFLNHDRKPIIKHPIGHPVAVIVAFNTIGDLIPRYFCVEDDTSELFKYKINAIKAIKDKPMIKIYECAYVVNGYCNSVTLCFDIAKCLWVIG